MQINKFTLRSARKYLYKTRLIATNRGMGLSVTDRREIDLWHWSGFIIWRTLVEDGLIATCDLQRWFGRHLSDQTVKMFQSIPGWFQHLICFIRLLYKLIFGISIKPGQIVFLSRKVHIHWIFWSIGRMDGLIGRHHGYAIVIIDRRIRHYLCEWGWLK